MEKAAEAARLRQEAEAKPLKLPVNRRVDERHRALTPDGLAVWYTIQVSPHTRIYDVLFEREHEMPADGECQEWLRLLLGERAAQAVEAPGFPGQMARRFDVFERDPSLEAPIS
jgi:hypothetical protein